jgi:hypothetical protein
MAWVRSKVLRRIQHHWSPIGAALIAVTWGCGNSTNPQPGSKGGNDTAGQGGTVAWGGGGDLALSPTGGASSSSSTTGCTPDLRSIVGEDGSIVEECPTDQGCAAGECIAACRAAALSGGSIGCEFWAPEPAFVQNGRGLPQDGPCYAVFLANAWNRPARINVSRAGKTFDITTFAKIPKGILPDVHYEPLPESGLPPDEVAVLFLSHRPGTVNAEKSLECPLPPALLADAAIQGSGRGSAFQIVSDTPLSAYDILPYGGALSYLPSATLLLPAKSWGTNSISVAPRGDGLGSQWALVAAGAEGATLRVAPRAALPGGPSLPSAPSGKVTEYVLGAGESVQWLDVDLAGVDVSGAVFESDKPVGLWTGNTYLGIASATSPQGGFHDAAHQQIPPVQALGSEYVGPGIVTRLPGGEPESVPYRLLGVVDGTRLTWDSSAPANAPLTLDQGQVADFETRDFFAVRSQDPEHPFALTQYMPGTPQTGTIDGCGVPPSQGLKCGLGDEDWINLVPPQQFLQRYVFFTDPTYATTNLVLLRARDRGRSEDATGFEDVTVDCLGVVDGWQPVGKSGKYQVSHVDLVRGNQPVSDCTTSRHVASSKGLFGLLVWGTDWAASYGYPAGGNLTPINEVVVTPVVK